MSPFDISDVSELPSKNARTLTIEPELDRLIQKEMRGRPESFKETINRLLRLGSQSQQRAKDAIPPLSITPIPMGLKEGYSLESVADLEELVEGN